MVQCSMVPNLVLLVPLREVSVETEMMDTDTVSITDIQSTDEFGRKYYGDEKTNHILLICESNIFHQ